jgi:hypothetical protein
MVKNTKRTNESEKPGTKYRIPVSIRTSSKSKRRQTFLTAIPSENLPEIGEKRWDGTLPSLKPGTDV